MAPGKWERLAEGTTSSRRRWEARYRNWGPGGGPAQGGRSERQSLQSCCLSGACCSYIPCKLLRVGELILILQRRKLRQGGKVTCPRKGRQQDRKRGARCAITLDSAGWLRRRYPGGHGVNYGEGGREKMSYLLHRYKQFPKQNFMDAGR